MARCLCLVLCVFCLSAGQAAAGAWPREKGGFFIASDLRLSWPTDLISPEPTGKYYTIYIEYGMTEQLTLGLDLGRSVSGDTKAVAFLRLPLRNRDTGLHIAAEVGLGQIDSAMVVRPGLALGRGFSIWRFNGWLALDSVAEVSVNSGKTDFKIDMTFGLNAEDGRKYMLQVQSGAPAAEDPFVRLAPSVVIPFGKDRHIELGGTYGLTGDDSVGIKLGVWQAF